MYISDKVRMAVAERANFQCEYYRIYESNSFYTFQVEHIISRKHGGNSDLDNLAYAYPSCNRLKGSDLGSILLPDEQFFRFFNPRKNEWLDNFEVHNSGSLYAKTSEAAITIKIFKLNHPDTVIERKLLIEMQRFP
ncbi:MAG: HNH endonuclease signature motif containing protein [Bacteroidota bacterium]